MSGSAGELELKLQVPPERRDALVAALGIGQWEALPLAARYYDTSDGALAAAGLSLRLRREGPRWVQTLKATGRSLVHRLEHEVEVATPVGSGDAPAVDAARHAGSAAGEALAAVMTGSPEALGAALVERQATRIERRRQDLQADAARIEAAFDEGRIESGGRSVPVCELELELKAGSPAGLFALARQLMDRHGLWLATASKDQRGRWLAEGTPHGPPVKARAPDLERGMTRAAVLRGVVGSCVAQMLPNAAALAAGSTADEHVHQLRVGIRRLRTALRELGDFAAGIAPAWEPVLVAAFRRLGEHRDRIAVAAVIEPRLAAAGAPLATWPAGEAAAPDPGEPVRDPAFQGVLLGLLAFSMDVALPPAGAAPAAAAPGTAAEGGGTPGQALPAKGVRRALRARLARLHRRVVRDGASFVQLAPEAQHRVRKRLKRLRYLAEFAAPLFETHAAERYLSQLRPAQDALGAHNDDAVALVAYREAAEHDPRAWFAVGWLTAWREQTARNCHDALAQVAAAPRFWKKSAR